VCQDWASGDPSYVYLISASQVFSISAFTLMPALWHPYGGVSDSIDL
jgi:hypothetical protein